MSNTVDGGKTYGTTEEGFEANFFEEEEGATFIDLGDLSDVPEQIAVASGEYQLRGISLELRKQKPEKGTGSFLMALMEIPSEPNSKLISHVMMIPDDSNQERTKNARLRAIRDFRVAFGLGISGPLNFRDFEGALGWAVLVEEEDPQYGVQNRVRKFTAPA